ncbi:hypothetical protein [uncultured phage cr114_1]|uniref:Uncharacterized protein n=3 Tax=Suoliviridae TaxID=2942966 RepID=A0A7M1RX36_9CAUD|nr:hypothetical protein KNV55_gp045 [uncultured phage cr114_1]YP_010113200.1 hypothetical protein KNV58_gp047 [uncultured phage cr125_1]QOR57560.1 hypothetical protein [uncultured phage cr125_1]QOR59980.1 hypothetical protein [uncultured phage cr114_1]
MKNIELLESFELELNKLDDNFTKPTTNTTEYFLNAGLDKFWKTRYSLNNPKVKGFELIQKRIDDLRTLVAEVTLVPDTTSKDLYTVTIPEDYVILLGDTAGISPADGYTDPCWELDSDGNYVIHYSDVLEGSIETIDRIKENSLSEYHLRYTKAKPIRLLSGNEIKLYTDGKYKVSKYILHYLRKPHYIDIHTEPFKEYTDMPEHTHLEIVKLAAQLYIENQANPRYNSYTLEVVPNME